MYNYRDVQEFKAANEVRAITYTTTAYSTCVNYDSSEQ